MKRIIVMVAIPLCFTLAGTRDAVAQKARTAQRKTTTKSKTQKKPPATMGTAQLPGDNGLVGQAYTLGKGTGTAVNFTLLKAEWSPDPFVVGEFTLAPTKEQKLLILTFTAHNPNPSELLFRYDSVDFTAVDSKGVNHEGIRQIVKAGDNKAPLQFELKPAQKIQAVTAILVPADAGVPKLMVQHPDDKRVLRYDLRKVVPPLKPPFAAGGDDLGASMLPRVPGIPAVFYPTDKYLVRFDQASFVATNLGENELEEGNRYLVVKLTIQNPTYEKLLLRYNTFAAELSTADGDKIPKKASFLRASSDSEASLELDPGATYTGRILFEISEELKPSNMVIWCDEGREYVFDLSAAR